MTINRRELAVRFAPVAVDEDRIAIKNRISAAAHDLAALIHELVPGSREEHFAIKDVERAMAWAHAAIDRRYQGRTERRPAVLDMPAAADSATEPLAAGTCKCPHVPAPVPAALDDPDHPDLHGTPA